MRERNDRRTKKGNKYGKNKKEAKEKMKISIYLK